MLRLTVPPAQTENLSLAPGPSWWKENQLLKLSLDLHECATVLQQVTVKSKQTPGGKEWPCAWWALDGPAQTQWYEL